MSRERKLPFVGCVMVPCDSSGLPAASAELEARLHYETKAFCLAWFGRVALFPFGAISRRALKANADE
jgi:hypothetical protein